MLMLSPSKQSGIRRVHLVRHGVHGDYGRILSGRSGTAGLTNEGRDQADRTARWPGFGHVAAIFASPQARTLETAGVMAAALGVRPDTMSDLDEVDFGAWSGLAFADLEGDARWDRWNAQRSIARTPEGETMGEAVARAVACVERLCEGHPAADILCVTHCDIIRGTLAHYLGLSLDNILRFDIDPASVSTVEWRDGTPVVTRVNEVPA